MTSLKPQLHFFENLFSKFNSRFFNNELQPAVITLHPTNGKKVLGWCSNRKIWEENDSDNKSTSNDGYFEINICPEFLSEPFEKVASILLHEMVHLWNSQQGISDTSRGGTYHNKHFRKEAEEHGLICELTESSGYAHTKLSSNALQFISNIPHDEISLHRKFSDSSRAKKNSVKRYICPKCKCIVRSTKPVSLSCNRCNKELVEQAKKN